MIRKIGLVITVLSLCLCLCACSLFNSPISITAKYNGPLDAGTVIDSSSDITVDVEYKNGDIKPATEWEIEGSTTLEPEQESIVTIKSGKLECAMSVTCETPTREHIPDCCIEVLYSDMERNPNLYTGEYIKVNGNVSWISENDSCFGLDYETFPNAYYIDYSAVNLSERILEGDYVTIYGECSGLKTYTNLLNKEVTLPQIKACYIEIFQENPDFSGHTIYNLTGFNPVDYNTRKNTNANAALIAELNSTWAIAYDGKGDYSEVRDSFYYPEDVIPDRFSKFGSAFENEDGYEWRGIHTTITFPASDWFVDWTFRNYDTSEDIEANVIDTNGYSKSDFSVNYEGKTYDKCTLIYYCYGTGSKFEMYSFFRIPKGFDRCTLSFVNNTINGSLNGLAHIETDPELVNRLGPDPVIIIIR